MPMDIVYLDQNKWIELARVQSGTLTSGPVADLYPELISSGREGTLSAVRVARA